MLVDIVLFGLSLSGFPSTLGSPFRASPQGFKTRLLGEGFHTLINGDLFSSPTNVGHHNPPPSGLASSLALFSSSNRCGTTPKSTTLWGPASLLAHRLVSTPFGEQREGWHIVRCPQIHHPLGPASLLAHRLVSTPLRGTARRLTHRPVSGSDTISNDPDPPLADIVLFGLPLKALKRVC